MRIALPALHNTGVSSAVGGRHPNALTLVRRLVDEFRPDLLVFPELSACGYPGLVDAVADDAALSAVAEPLIGPTASSYAELSRKSQCTIVFGLCELDDSGLRYNTVVLADPAGTLTGYRKIHLTERERRHFSAGTHAVVADTGIGRIGLSSCYDKMFPQVYQRQRERGGQISVIASAWSSRSAGAAGSADTLADQSLLFDRARAAETGMVVISTNYEGPKLPGSVERFCGGQRVIDGLGQVVAPSRHGAGVSVWEFDVEQAARAVHAFNDGDFYTRDSRRVR
ncbi:carbon-nitrogen hydrolase family protein [Mycolicibacterium sp. CH28]|uniref:carbon-nitrogen hydrolase family protein n=1 Tax=Mycolicibacterium sp. CH28 TaxID=2512237 RepID=UPI00108164CB|nr:carbon-nitrogen hydrolase family protein [Mycolicibacterium sp. CH28]TGD87512.1 carbon-nitrogen hydrolase family protein [Mycolicibacterium sp. CH28]